MSKLLPIEDFDSIALLEADEHPLDKEQRNGNGQSGRTRIVKNEADVKDSMMPFHVEKYQRLRNLVFHHDELNTNNILAQDETEVLAESQILTFPDGLR
ncbi:hypothetical protein N7504_011967 [Penicillium tannophilum]|nr:hypothetical protein N7504_011967 [Penicillium tannophilum]